MTTVSEHKELEKKFELFFMEHGYLKLDPVGITSGIDKTVYLINSATNLFKSYFSGRNVCVFVIQPSMRTQNLNDYYREEYESEYPTCFESYGVYVSTEHIKKLISDTIAFFVSIGFEIPRMRVRASFEDSVLLEAIESSTLKNMITMDKRTEKYDHVYGLGITGRAIKLDYYQEWQMKHKNLCYFIIIYVDGVPKGAELATSDQLILMRLKNQKYAISVAKVAELLPVGTFEQRRFADSIVGAANMIFEGIRPNSSNTNGRTLKKYIKAISYFGDMLDIPLTERSTIIERYIHLCFATKVDREVITRYLSQLNISRK